MAIYGEALFREICGSNRQAFAYNKCNNFLKRLRQNERRLTQEQIRELKRRAVSGDLDGAEDQFWDIMRSGKAKE